MKQPKFTKEKVIEALNANFGMVYLAAKSLDCQPKTIYNYIERWPDLQEVINKHRGELLDTAELKLKQKVLAGDNWAIGFTLKTIGKDRGYVDRQEITGEDGQPFKVYFGIDESKL